MEFRVVVWDGWARKKTLVFCKLVGSSVNLRTHTAVIHWYDITDQYLTNPTSIPPMRFRRAPVASSYLESVLESVWLLDARAASSLSGLSGLSGLSVSTPAPALTHTGPTGKASMVDVSEKILTTGHTLRSATARGTVRRRIGGGRGYRIPSHSLVRSFVRSSGIPQRVIGVSAGSGQRV